MQIFPQTATSIISAHLHGQRLTDDFQRLLNMRAAQEAYQKEDKPPFPVEAGRPDDNVRVNLIKLIVKTGVGYLFGDNVQFRLKDGKATTKDDPEEEWLNACWAANRLMTWLYKQGINGSLCGHVFARLYPGDPYPRVVLLDPATVTVRWAADDLDLVNRYIIEYAAYEWQGNNEVLVTVRQMIERNAETGAWMIYDQRGNPDQMGRTSAFTTIHEEAWPYPWPPIIDTQNMPAPNVYWGEPDVTPDLIALVNAGDFTLSSNQRVLRFHAQPLTVGKGMRPEQLQQGRDRTVFIPETADLFTVEMESDLQAGLEQHSRIKASVHEVSQIPEVAAGKVDSIGNLSGLALSILYGPLVQKTNEKRMLYGEWLREINRRLLEMGGFANRETTIVWPEVVPGDPEAERRVAAADLKLGVSKETTLTKLGYDAAEETKKRDAEKPAMPAVPLAPGMPMPGADPMMKPTDQGDTPNADPHAD